MSAPQSHRPRIVVIGSVNMDLVVAAPAIPAPGQTILGGDFATIPGGKGANQAVAAARLGAAVSCVGRVGDDAFAQVLRKGLRAAGVDDTFLRTTNATASGVALIVVAPGGENAICVAPGANACLTPADIDRAEETIASAQVCLLQLETPAETVAHAAALARQHGVEVILDPAPAPAVLPAALWDVDVLTPNETEAAQLLAGEALPAEPAGVGAALRGRGPRAVVLTLGAAGCYVSEAAGDVALPGHAVPAVDATAAGDAFSAALAVARAEGRSLREAARFANAAGALACTKRGAQPSAPTRDEVSMINDQ